MSKIEYTPKKFRPASLKIIQQANAVIDDYRERGLDLTLRQLYYQFVARDLLRNTDKNYKRLGSIINDARMAGLVDWQAIIDRTRKLYGTRHYDDPGDAIASIVDNYAIDLWQGQRRRVEVWVEKEALAGVIAQAVDLLDVDYFPCRGYVSQSAQWRAAMRLTRYARNGQPPIIIHLGDHDPSGIDMSRDILDRIALFMESHGVEPATVERIALNMNQIERYGPPPNPAKLTDSRAGGYVAEHGYKSWELDALDPSILIDLVRSNTAKYMDADKFAERKAQQEAERLSLKKIADNFDDVAEFLDSLD